MSDPESERVAAALDAEPKSEFLVREGAVLSQTQAEPAETRFLKWVVLGPQGVRAGWSALLFLVLMLLVTAILGTGASVILKTFHMRLGTFSATSTAVGDGLSVVGLLVALLLVARLDGRSIGSYYLKDSRMGKDFFSGIAGGFLALSALVFTLYFGGFLRFGPATPGTGRILGFALLWAVAFLMVGLSEEGTFRSYLLYTLARGMNFWWSAGSVGMLCLFTALNTKGNGSAGVYTMAALGVLPCLWLQARSHSGFWQAAWFTSTGFGYVHTFNAGESWLGIFAAAAIGFVFCVSIRLTGSAWWAIGFHAAWDWTQTFFYGTPDSGLAPQGHYLATTAQGAVLWSGGKDGPEGSLLVLPTIVLVLLVLVLLYRRRKLLPTSFSPSTEPQLS